MTTKKKLKLERRINELERQFAANLSQKVSGGPEVNVQKVLEEIAKMKKELNSL